MSKSAVVKFVNKQGEWVEEVCHDPSTCREHKTALLRTGKLLKAKPAVMFDEDEILASDVMSVFEQDFEIGVEPESIAQAVLMAESFIGKTFKDVDVKGTFSGTAGDNSRNKGFLGNLFQENVYGLDANSDKDADLKSLGLELKVVPLVRNVKGQLRPKERIVANIINFEEEDLTGDFTKSSFFKKNAKSLFVFYELSDRKDATNNKIVKVLYHDLEQSSEYSQLVEDYKKITDKIRSGEAHKISGRDTELLEACTKGAGKGKDLRKQPNSSVPAKQRAYALKTKYVASLLDK